MATDKEIRDAGLLYIPKQKYLQNPYNLPIAPVPPPASGGIVNTNAFTNSGGGETRYDNSFLPDLPQFNYVDMVRKYGADSKQAQQMLTKAGATYPGGFQSNEGGFQYTNSFPDNSIQMENLDNNYSVKGNTFQGKQFNQSIEDEKAMIADMASEEDYNPNAPANYTYNKNRFSTIDGQKNVFDVNVQGDPALNPGSKMAQGDDPYSEKAFQEEEDKKSFLSKMISRAKQVGSDLPGWAKAAATAIGGPFAAAVSFLGSGKNYEKFDPRGNIKGGVYTVDGVNYANLDNVNDFYDNDPSSSTYGTTRFDRAAPNSFASYRTLSAYLNRDKGNDNDNNVTTTTPNTTTPNTTTPNTDYEDQSYEGGGGGGFNNDNSTGYDEGNFCFDPKTPIQMADGSTKKIKNIQLGDNTKGGEVTGVFQFKASDEIHDYKGVTVAGSHYVKENGRFIMVKDSPLSVKIDKIPVVYSLDTTGRRIFINDIEFADYNGDGVAKNFLTNAGVNLSGFDKEVLRQVEQRLI
jgi:hypothetical protein